MNTDTDVLVIGSGAAGMMAAVEAAEAGAKTLLVESEPGLGGSTALSGGYVTLCETEMEPGSREELLEDLLHSHAGDCQTELSEIYVDTAPILYRRLKSLGIRFMRTYKFAHMRRPWAHELSGREMTGGAEIIKRLADAARERCVQIEERARVVRLHADADGRPACAEVDADGGRRMIEIGRSAIIATGGFTRNREMIKNYGRPGTEAIHPVTGAGSRGDGLKLAMGLGADMSYVTAGIAPTIPADPKTGKGVITFYVGGIALNKNGERFCDESQLYTKTCWKALEQPEALIVQIYDSAMKSALADTMIGKALAGHSEYGAPTLGMLLAELERDSGLDAARAADTIAAYNRDVREGEDRTFSRKGLVGVSGTPRPIEMAPFHAAVTYPGTTHFNGGIAIDGTMRVRNVYGEPIGSLYAAGETTGGFHGAGYMSGTFVGMALIFGMIAGKNAAHPRLPSIAKM